jgi:tetratricopeptide (TPR) repeat protein
MRKSWRMYLMILLFGAWPQLGCHQLPGDKSVKDLTPIQQKSGADKRQELTAADITQTWLTKAEQLEKEGKSGEAIALCEKMREPGNPQALQATKRIALLYDRTHDLDKAEQEYQRLLTQNPDDAETLCNLGYLCYKRGHWGIAEKHLRKALTLQPSHVYANVNLGMTLAQQGYKDASVEAFAKVLPKADAYCEVGFIMKLQGKPREAIQMYEAALKLEPAMPRASAELTKLRATVAIDPATPSSTQRVANPDWMKRGTVEQVDTPIRVIEGASRQMQVRPTLSSVLDFDMPASEPSSSKKK